MTRREMVIMLCRVLGKVVATLIWLLIIILSVWGAVEISDWLVISLWNYSVHQLTSLPAMTHYQGVTLALLCDILIGRSTSEEMEKELKEIKESFLDMLKDFYKAVDVLLEIDKEEHQGPIGPIGFHR